MYRMNVQMDKYVFQVKKLSVRMDKIFSKLEKSPIEVKGRWDKLMIFPVKGFWNNQGSSSKFPTIGTDRPSSFYLNRSDKFHKTRAVQSLIRFIPL